MSKRSIPEAVKEAASFILSCEGGAVEYIGTHKGEEIYIASIEDGPTGFPEVYAFDGTSVTELRRASWRALARSSVLARRSSAVGADVFPLRAMPVHRGLSLMK